MTKQNEIEREIDNLINKYGIERLLFALAKRANERGHPVVSRRLLKVYLYLKGEEK